MAEIPALGLSVVLDLDVYAAKESGYNKSEKKVSLKSSTTGSIGGGDANRFMCKKSKTE